MHRVGSHATGYTCGCQYDGVVPKDFYTIPTKYTALLDLPSIHSTSSLSPFRCGNAIRG